MDNNIIGQNNFISNFNYGTQAEKKAPVKPQEEFVTEWQMPTDDLVSFQAPVKEKAPSKPQAEIVTDWQMPTETKTPEKPAETASRVPTTLRMDDPDQLADFLNWGIQRNEFGNAPMADTSKLNLSGPIDIMGLDTVKMADSTTAFYKIGLNTINSIAKDGIFTVDGEQLAKPGV